VRTPVAAPRSAVPGESPPGAPRGDGGRLIFVDVLRVAVIVMVVAHHSAQPYGPTGGAWPVADPENLEWLGSFFLVNAAFGMGLLFLLAGYFVPRSYDRKGTKRFLEDRWARIGLPLTMFALLVHVPVAYLLAPERLGLTEFMRSLYESGLQNVYVHLWFLGHLLLYSVGYATWRLLADRRSNNSPGPWATPNHAGIVGFIVGLALVTWVVRWWYPIDAWVPLFFLVAAEPAHLPQYVGLFVLGAVAYRGDWLRRIPASVGLVWLIVGLVASAAIAVLRSLAPDQWSDVVALGGFNWPSLVYSTWEALICVGLSVGLIVLFRTVFQRSNRLLIAMAAASYAAYMVHVMIVIGLQVGISDLDLPAFMKLGLVSAFGVLLAFGIGHLSRWVPGARMLLGTAPPSRRP
jgi:glucan biosynthesis protein C